MIEDLVQKIPLDKAYDDLASPALKEVGDMLHNGVKSLRFLFAPIDILVKQQDRFQNFLKRIDAKVDSDNLIDADPRIIGETFEVLKYSKEDSILTELFINLLAKSVDKTKQSKCHPAFPNIIRQLSPDEAVIIFYLKREKYELKNHSDFDVEKALFVNNTVIYNKFPLDKLNSPENFFIYMNHLNSLNLAGIWQRGNQVPIYNNNTQTGVDIYNEIRLTEFGMLFAEAVIPNNIEIFSDIKS